MSNGGKMKELVCQLGATIEGATVTLYMGDISEEVRGCFQIVCPSLYSDSSCMLESLHRPEANVNIWRINGKETDYDQDYISYTYSTETRAQQGYENLCFLIDIAGRRLVLRNESRNHYLKKLRESYRKVEEANNVLELAKHLTFGFEWETQQIDSGNMEDLYDAHSEARRNSFDQDAYDAARREYATTLMTERSVGECAYTLLYSIKHGLLKFFDKHPTTLDTDRLSSLTRGSLWDNLDALRAFSSYLSATDEVLGVDSNIKELCDAGLLDEEMVLDELSKTVSISKSEFYRVPENFGVWADQEFGNGHLEIKADGSVNGPEITTNGAKDMKTFMECAHYVEDYLGPDSDCASSFHLHVGMSDGTEFKYSQSDLRALYEYLLNHIDMVPKSVRRRWRGGASGDSEYFQMVVQNHKYTFAHFHPKFKTIEFRCFGNVNTADEARVCLFLAAKAVQYMIQKKMTGRKSIYDGLTQHEVEQLFNTCLVEGKQPTHPSMMQFFKEEFGRELVA